MPSGARLPSSQCHFCAAVFLAASILSVTVADEAAAQPTATAGLEVATSFTQQPDGVITYQIQASFSAPLAAVQIGNTPSNGISASPQPGWRAASMEALGFQIERGDQTHAVTQVTLGLSSQYLPGVAEVRAFPAQEGVPWDQALPTVSAPALAPVIVLDRQKPLHGAVSLLDDIIFQVLVPSGLNPRVVEAPTATIRAALSSIERGDVPAAVAILQQLISTVSTASPATDRWDRDVATALAFNLSVAVSLLLTPEGTPSDSGAHVERAWLRWTPSTVDPSRHLVSGGISDDVVAVVGTLEQLRMELVDGEMRTLLVLRTQELLLGTLTPDERSDTRIWLRGGTATEASGVAKSSRPGVVLPQGTARQLFVMARRFYREGSPLSGQLYIDEPDSLCLIVNTGVLAVNSENAWVEDVLTIGSRSGLALDSANDARLLLDTIRHLRAIR